MILRSFSLPMKSFTQTTPVFSFIVACFLLIVLGHDRSAPLSQQSHLLSPFVLALSLQLAFLVLIADTVNLREVFGELRHTLQLSTLIIQAISFRIVPRRKLSPSIVILRFILGGEHAFAKSVVEHAVYHNTSSLVSDDHFAIQHVIHVMNLKGYNASRTVGSGLSVHLLVLVSHNHRVALIISAERIGGGAFQRTRRVAPLHALDKVIPVENGDGSLLLSINIMQI